MRIGHRLVSFGFGTAFVAALSLCAVTFAPSARAEDEGGEEGDGEAAGLEKKIKEQMDKIVRLMRENEKAILQASQGSAKKPAGANVDVPPADGSTSAKPEGGGDASPEGSPGARGDEIKKQMEEVIRSTQSEGGSIPKELEELVKLIPT